MGALGAAEGPMAVSRAMSVPLTFAPGHRQFLVFPTRNWLVELLQLAPPHASRRGRRPRGMTTIPCRLGGVPRVVVPPLDGEVPHRVSSPAASFARLFVDRNALHELLAGRVAADHGARQPVVGLHAFEGACGHGHWVVRLTYYVQAPMLEP